MHAVRSRDLFLKRFVLGSGWNELDITVTFFLNIVPNSQFYMYPMAHVLTAIPNTIWHCFSSCFRAACRLVSLIEGQIEFGSLICLFGPFSNVHLCRCFHHCFYCPFPENLLRSLNCFSLLHVEKWGVTTFWCHRKLNMLKPQTWF